MACRHLARSRLAAWLLLLVGLASLSACGGQKTPRVILVTATPTPGPQVLIVTATPTPGPQVLIVTATPSPQPPAIVTATPEAVPSATVTASVPGSGIVVLPLVWQSQATPP